MLDTQQLIGVLQAHWKEAGGFAAAVLGACFEIRPDHRRLGAQHRVIPVVAFYLLRDWDIMVARIHALMPRSIEPAVARLARESDDVLGAFLRGQLSVMVVLGVVLRRRPVGWSASASDR